MILIWLVLIPMIGGVIAWLAGRANPGAARWTALITMAIELILSLVIWFVDFNDVQISALPVWVIDLNLPWIPQLGIGLHMAMDGLNLILVMLTAFLGLIAIAASWSEIHDQVGFFFFNILWVLAGIVGVFLSLDLFLFYFFWEMMLVPMYLLIAYWGHENRRYAAVKFFLFTQLSGLLMLLAILGLYFIHGNSTGAYTFDYSQLLGTRIPGPAATWLALGFLAAFLTKLPAFPLHTWLPDAHTEAPTAGSIILAGLMLKTGAYGLIRFVVPLFPGAAQTLSPLMLALGVIGILYGALMALGQSDLKRLVAYTSVSHMGFVLLGVFSWNAFSLQGTVLEIIAHGLSTGALFALAGALQERTGTRDMNKLGGLWSTTPHMAGIGLLFALASMGLPGLANFVAEFLILLGTFQVSVWAAVLASLGLITSTVYSLWIIQRVFHGPNTRNWKLADFNPRELVMMGSMIAVILWLGLYPQPILNTSLHTINFLQSATTIQARPSPQAALPLFNANTAPAAGTVLQPVQQPNPGGTP
jgi:NADH-quinone oxidoreductase subunit M